jgi:hypothetical protein
VKLIAYLLMALATMAGSISAATAYLVPIEKGRLPAEMLEGIRLAAPAGAYDPSENEELKENIEALLEQSAEAEADAQPEPLITPQRITVETEPLPEVDTAQTGRAMVRDRDQTAAIAPAGTTLNDDWLTILRDADVEYVKSASFEPRIWFTMWPSWVFLGSVVVLVGSAMMVRAASKSAGKTAPEAGAAMAGGPGDVPSEPAAIARTIQQQVESVVEDVKRLPTEKAQLALIVERLGEVQRTLVPAFAASRPKIIARFGMGGYAQVMDVFAASERRINRAWSAAADGAEDEALNSLHDADRVLPQLVERLEQL